MIYRKAFRWGKHKKRSWHSSLQCIRKFRFNRKLISQYFLNLNLNITSQWINWCKFSKSFLYTNFLSYLNKFSESQMYRSVRIFFSVKRAPILPITFFFFDAVMFILMCKKIQLKNWMKKEEPFTLSGYCIFSYLTYFLNDIS